VMAGTSPGIAVVALGRRSQSCLSMIRKPDISFPKRMLQQNLPRDANSPCSIAL